MRWSVTTHTSQTPVMEVVPDSASLLRALLAVDWHTDATAIKTLPPILMRADINSGCRQLIRESIRAREHYFKYKTHTARVKLEEMEKLRDLVFAALSEFQRNASRLSSMALTKNEKRNATALEQHFINAMADLQFRDPFKTTILVRYNLADKSVVSTEHMTLQTRVMLKENGSSVFRGFTSTEAGFHFAVLSFSGNVEHFNSGVVVMDAHSPAKCLGAALFDIDGPVRRCTVMALGCTVKGHNVGNTIIATHWSPTSRLGAPGG